MINYVVYDVHDCHVKYCNDHRHDKLIIMPFIKDMTVEIYGQSNLHNGQDRHDWYDIIDWHDVYKLFNINVMIYINVMIKMIKLNDMFTI